MKIMKFIINHLTTRRSRYDKESLLDYQKIALVFGQFLRENRHFHGVQCVQLTMTVCGRRKIQSLNRDYRNKNKVTDVLSFGVHENLREDQGPFHSLGPVVEIGDIFICREKAMLQARGFNITFEMELIHLLAHGLLHLLGYDHEISELEEKKMEALESKLVKKIYAKCEIGK